MMSRQRSEVDEQVNLQQMDVDEQTSVDEMSQSPKRAFLERANEQLFKENSLVNEITKLREAVHQALAESEYYKLVAEISNFQVHMQEMQSNWLESVKERFKQNNALISALISENASLRQRIQEGHAI